ncbi:MAG: crossover junction endodeoxyribonuclease RuvC [Candidatus Paceibacterota bacterium]
MIILGIDPGYDRLGIAVIEKPVKGKELLLYSDCFRTSAKSTIYERFELISIEIGRILDEYKPDVMALETLFIDSNKKSGMRVAEARGIIIIEGIKRGVPIHEYSPMSVKMAITGDGTSDKTRMTKMVKLLIKMPPEKALDDEYDAVAVALTHAATAR